jgi:hypothetical protein
MKNLRTSMLCVCITLFSLCTSAQDQKLPDQQLPVSKPDYNKPKLFNSLPENISVDISNLSSLLNTPVGNAVSIDLGSDTPFKFEGRVVSAASKFENTIQSIVIRSTNFPGARLTFSKINNSDGSFSYTGRIMSFQHDDLFELQNQNGHFALIKRKFNDLVNE